MDNAINTKTQRAYRLYSEYYALISLLAYWLVWRGRIFKHINFFRETLKQGSNILDLATGDGSLTKVALLHKNSPLQKLECLDLSEDMLEKARKKIMDPRVHFVLGDVMRLPYTDEQWSTVSCFGGFNSFPAGAEAMKEIFRIMKPGGTLRGSVLMMPKQAWRQNLVKKWIAEGYQTEIVTPSVFRHWVESSSFQFKQEHYYGDVLLFELVKP